MRFGAERVELLLRFEPIRFGGFERAHELGAARQHRLQLVAGHLVVSDRIGECAFEFRAFDAERVDSMFELLQCGSQRLTPLALFGRALAALAARDVGSGTTDQPLPRPFGVPAEVIAERFDDPVPDEPELVDAAAE